MFEQPIVRVSIADGQAERLEQRTNGRLLAQRSARDGRRLAYKSVEARTMGDVAVMDVDEPAAPRSSPTSIPSCEEFALGDAEAGERGDRSTAWRSGGCC